MARRFEACIPISITHSITVVVREEHVDGDDDFATSLQESNFSL